MREGKQRSVLLVIILTWVNLGVLVTNLLLSVRTEESVSRVARHSASMPVFQVQRQAPAASRAEDRDGNALTYMIIAPAKKGNVLITNVETGSFTYTPEDDANGADTFTYVARDGVVDSNPAVVEITRGMRVSFHRRDPSPAPYTIRASDGSFESWPLENYSQSSHRFTKSGVFEYFLREHPEVRGTIKVR